MAAPPESWPPAAVVSWAVAAVAAAVAVAVAVVAVAVAAAVVAVAFEDVVEPQDRRPSGTPSWTRPCPSPEAWVTQHFWSLF